MKNRIFALLFGVIEFVSNGFVAEAQNITHGPSGDSDCILSQVLYTKEDSLIIVNMLRCDIPDKNDVLFYAYKFISTPYVAHTLEKEDPEKLVVNLRQLDCLTYVETVIALTMTKRQNSDRFADYCQNLMNIRYRQGIMDGYLSRLHYFSWWMEDNIKRNNVFEIFEPRLFTQKKYVNNNYMSNHPSSYPFLKNNKVRIDSIASMEKSHNGKVWYYIPASLLESPAAQIDSVIRSGDILALVTKKQGLDFSHLGFAVWGKDERLHLLNASSIHQEVVVEKKTLRKYMRERPSCLGVSVLRLVR